MEKAGSDALLDWFEVDERRNYAMISVDIFDLYFIVELYDTAVQLIMPSE